jgi:hypothetical protein
MKKTLCTLVLTLLLSAVPAAIFAACADLITTSNGLICVLTSSSTSPTGIEICRYSCGKETPKLEELDN